jgi:hypothetical protein
MSNVEQLLYAYSDEFDPTLFDADPGYNFPVIADEEWVATIHVRRAMLGCDAIADVDSARTYRASSWSHSPDGRPIAWLPTHLAPNGEVAVLHMTDYYSWYYIAARDSTWLTPFAMGTSGDARQPVSVIAGPIKERIRMRLEK